MLQEVGYVKIKNYDVLIRLSQSRDVETFQQIRVKEGKRAKRDVKRGRLNKREEESRK